MYIFEIYKNHPHCKTKKNSVHYISAANNNQGNTHFAISGRWRWKPSYKLHAYFLSVINRKAVLQMYSTYIRKANVE